MENFCLPLKRETTVAERIYCLAVLVPVQILPLTLLDTKDPKLYGSFGLPECNNCIALRRANLLSPIGLRVLAFCKDNDMSCDEMYPFISPEIRSTPDLGIAWQASILTAVMAL